MIFAVVLSSLAVATASPAGELAARSLEARTKYVSGWCGQALAGSRFNEVEATWKMPKSSPTSAQKQDQPIYNYQWVGIDGAVSDCQALLQAGTYYRMEDNVGSYGFWYEFYPNGSWLLDSPKVTPGDEIYVKVTATSKTTGTAYMENKTTGKHVTVNLTAPDGSELCQSNVEWIQENASDEYDALARFSTFSFDNAYATDEKGNSYNLKGSESWIIQNGDDSTRLCHPSSITDTSVTINYDGPR